MKYDEREFFADLLLESIKTGRDIQYSMNGIVWNTFSKEKVFLFDSSPKHYRLEPAKVLLSVAFYQQGIRQAIKTCTCIPGQGTMEDYADTKQRLTCTEGFSHWIVLDIAYDINPEP